MILSEDRQSHWAHLVTDAVWGDDIVDFSDDDHALRAAKRAIADFVAEEVNRLRERRLPKFDVGAEKRSHFRAVSYTHLRAHETVLDLVCRFQLEKKNT